MKVFRSDIKGLLPYAGGGVLLIVLAWVLFYCSGAENVKAGLPPSYILKVAGNEVTVELARTPLERQLGLKHRRWLPESHGMLFVFPEEKHLSFWMKDTYIPISIAFISRDGNITQIEYMEPMSLHSHVSQEEAMYALEMTAGWFERHHVKVGDKVELPPEVASN